MLKVICLVGPTGAGKSALALKLAQELDGWIINADSRQVYADFPVITAQPSWSEQGICPHKLYGFLDLSQTISAGIWAELARQCIVECHLQGKQPILVGGTGLYLRALFDGMVDIPELPAQLTARLLQEYLADSAGLYARLQQIDPAYTKRIHPNDKQRLTRALAVYEFTGQTFTWWHGQTPPPPEYEVERLGLKMPLSELEPLLAKRIDLMLAQGALAEAETAYAKNSNGKAPGWSGIGCRELYSYLSGELSLDLAKDLWLKKTRSYAKRQLTWFNADSRIQWN